METVSNRLIPLRLVKIFIFLSLVSGYCHSAHITRISTNPNIDENTLYCSMSGGCRFYIHGTGFDLGYDNQVMVGAHPCIVDDYYTSTELIVCEMPPMFYGIQDQVPIVMKVKGLIVECKTGRCHVYFRYNRTPSLNVVTPQSVFAGDQVNLGGYFRAEHVADLKEIRISQRNCELTEDQVEEQGLSYGGYSTLGCKVPLDMENGDHTISITSGIGTGFSHPLRDSMGFTVGTTTTEYNLRVHPKITSISASSGYLNGQKLEIKGNGFGNIKEDVVVKLEDVDCVVLKLEEFTEETLATETEEATETKYQKITCDLKPRSADFTEKMFKGGVGLRNQVFEGSTNNFASLMGEVTRAVRYDRTMLSMENMLLESDYTQRIWGIFRSLDAGKYTFKISGDDYCSFYISETPINFDVEFDRSTLPDPLCYIQGWTDFRTFTRYDSQVCEYTLEANKDYYVMLFQQEGGGHDHLTVGVTVPNSDNTKPNQSPQVQKIEIINNPDRQQLKLKAMNAIGGTFTLVFQERDPNTGANVYFKETADLDFDIEAELLCTRIRQRVGTSCTAVRKYLDQSQNVTSDPTKAKGFQWEITFEGYRSRPLVPAFKTSKLIGEGITVNAEETKQQSPSVEGNFTLKYGDVETRINKHYYSGNNIRNNLREIPALFEGITSYHEGASADGRTWYVSMDSIIGKSLDLKVGSNNLTGGKTGSPQIQIDPVHIAHTTAQTYTPIPSDLLRTIHSTPQIVVQIKDHMAGCDLESCSYTYQPQASTPSVTAFTLSGKELSITVANPAGRILAASDDASMDNISVRFGNTDCEMKTVSWPTITCTMPSNSNGTIQMESGSFVPMVHMEGKGYFYVDTQVVTPHDVPLTISSVSPAQGSIGGGTTITISGQGFANNSSYGNSNTVTVGGNACEIKSFDTSTIVCVTPEGSASSSEISVTANGTSQTSSAFSYNDSITPKITSLTPDNSSPVLKKDLVINGTGFDSDSSRFTVWLKPEEADGKEYECNTVSSTSTQITCRLSGGKKGSYQIKVHMNGVGYSMPASSNSNVFKYRSTVSSISPTTGSKAGGTVLTITGTNFSTIKNENQVSIGESGMNHCLILTATETELTCQMKLPVEIDSEAVNGEDVHVLGRVQESADCTGTCKFEYTDANTPTVSSISPLVAQTGNTITVNGTGFTASLADTSVTVGEKTANVLTVASNKITFEMPAMEFGTHEPRITIGNKGYALFDSVMMLESNLVINSVSPRVGSRDGAIFTIQGNGFKTEDMTLKVHNTVCETLSLTNNELVASCGSINSTSEKSVVIMYDDADNIAQTITCDDCTFTGNGLRPYIKEVVSANTSDLTNVVIGINGDYLKFDNSDTPVQHQISDVKVWLEAVNRDNVSIEGTPEFSVTGVNCTFPNMMAGVYRIKYHVNGFGYARRHSDVQDFVLVPVVTSIPKVNSSLVGGSTLTISGKGFPVNSLKEQAMIKVCGQHCVVSESTFDTLKCNTPVINTKAVHEAYDLISPGIQRDAVVTGDRTTSDMNKIIDGEVSTYYYGLNSGQNCYVNLDFGLDTIINATKIRLFPRPGSHEQYLEGGKLIGITEDGTETVLAVMPENVMENWNVFKPDPLTNEEWNFRHLKFIGNEDHKRCEIGEIEVTGFKFAGIQDLNINGHDCDVSIDVAGSALEGTPDLKYKVSYKISNTPKVTGLNPILGTTVGGTSLTITGENFSSNSTVLIDGIECPIDSSTSTSIVCTTGARPTFTESTLEITSPDLGRAATQGHVFLYIDRWSDPNTWGGEAPPRAGDSVHVPKGQVLLVDVSPPELYAVIVEGVIMWEDKSRLQVPDLSQQTFDAWFIMVREGQFKIGAPDLPYEGNLTITLHGNRESKQLPGFGNKSIMVHNGQIDIHGKPVTKTWTYLEIGAVPGDKQVTLTEASEWKVGDKIIITSTGQSREETEERYITEVNGKVLKFEEGLEFYHFSGEIDPNKNHNTGDQVEANNTIDPAGRDQPFILRGEVGLLTRNVKIQGDETTIETGHGVHIMLRGEEGVARGRYSYMEVFRAGQKFQLGRYPIHFHMIGHVVDNYVRGCAVHKTFNRGTTLHGIHFLVLEKNVYYDTMGHTIFLEDGIETNNIIQHNLVVYVNKSTAMLKSDLKPSGLWQSRATNLIRENNFVGCAGNGVWFEPSSHPTGPSATKDICSKHDPLVQFDRNIMHSNTIGLRIYPFYVPLKNPCASYINNNFRDPYSVNEAVPAVLKNNIMYMNGLGSFGKIIGAIQYYQQIMVSNRTNQKILSVKNTKDRNARTEDSVSIGESELVHFHKVEDGTRNKFINCLGFLLPKNSGFWIKDTRFYNFKNGNLARLCTACGDETKREMGGAQVNWVNNQFKNVNVNLFLYREAMYDKDIQYDIDGSLIKILNLPSNKRSLFNSGGWITPWLPHLDVPECIKISAEGEPVENGGVDEKHTAQVNFDSAVCSSSINLRRLRHTVTNDTLLLYGQDMKLFNLGKHNDDSNPNGFTTDMNSIKEQQAQEGGRLLGGRSLQEEVNTYDEKFGFNKFRNCQLSLGWRGWLSVIPTSYKFNFHFGEGVEWIEMKTKNDYFWGLYGQEQEVYLRHNHTEPRENFSGSYTGVGINDDDDFGELAQEQIQKAVLASGSSFGDYFVDTENQMISWKIDEKRIGEYTNKAIYCEGDSNQICGDESEVTSVIETTQRMWSEVASWSTTNALPTADDAEVIIEETWNMVMDISPPDLKHLRIKGRLTFKDDVDELKLRAYNIQIHYGGELIIGAQDRPHTNKATIELLGDKASPYMNVTTDIAPINKAIFNKGKLHIHGKPMVKTWSRLGGKVVKGDSFFYVYEKGLDWNVGDELVVAASSQSHLEREKVVIKQIIEGSTNTEIKIEGTFEYNHYGGTQKNQTSKGEIDVRAEVGNLTRNVKIVSDLTDKWGCTVLTPQFTPLESNASPLQGNLVLDGVEIQNCGQRDTRKAAIDLNWVKQIYGTHSVKNCSFNNGQGWAINIEKAEGIEISNNVIYDARRYGIYMGELVKGVKILNNLIIGIKERENYDNIEYFDTLVGIFHNDNETYWDQTDSKNSIIMTGNSVSSSPWFGYAVPGISCQVEKDENKNDVIYPILILNSRIILLTPIEEDGSP